MIGDDVAALHERLSAHGLKIPESETGRGFFGPATRNAVLEIQKRNQLVATGQVDTATATAILTKPADSGPLSPAARGPVASEVRAAGAATPEGRIRTGVLGEIGGAGPAGPPVGAPFLVAGTIALEHGLPANGVALRLYRVTFGGVEARIAEGRTDAVGGYTLSFADAGSVGQLEVRAVDAQGKEVRLSQLFPLAEAPETMNLVAPASVQPAAPEYSLLAGDLTAKVGDLNNLSKARENDDQPDLTLLHEATGWDARLIATAAIATKLRAEITADKLDLPEDGLYAMLRAGLPSDKLALAGVSAGTVELALKKATAAGIVAFDDEKVAKVKAAFQSFSRETRLAATAPGASSSYRTLLSQSGLSAEKQEKFATLYLAHRGTPSELWQKARDNGIEDAAIDQLRLQGKLAYLTHNNAELIQSLQSDGANADDLSPLVEKDFHTPEAWKTRLQTVAGGDAGKLAQLIPPAFTTLDAYAEDMGRRVEASYPNHVVARIVKADKLLGNDEDAGAVGHFFTTAAKLESGDPNKKGFKIGEASVDALVRLYGDQFFPVGTPRERIEKTTTAAKIVQRVYQFTPSNDAMKVLFQHGLTSAHAVTAISKASFLDRYGRHFPSMDDAAQIYDKAAQISGTVQNVANLAKQLGRGAMPLAIGGTEDQRNAATKQLQAELLKHYPTMESLFGSLDFCECEHCRSVLSPAAYFVDLLSFIDPDEETVWKGFLQDWEFKHNGTPYIDNYKKPFDALMDRRPDLPHIPATCENTLTALPYIDLAIEILEFWVAHGGLTKNAVRDTGEATPAELLAEPQNVIVDAYDKLKGGRYPLALPFDLWLTTVRRFLDYFETPLWQVLEAFRTTDKLLPPNPPDISGPGYYRAEIFAEQLGLSPAEYALFTDPAPLANWHQLFGFDESPRALEALRSAKTLSRRLGVTYKEVVEVVRTGFVNPRLEALNFLPRLGISADTLLRYKGQPGHPPLTPEELTALEDRLKERAVELNLTVEDLKARIDSAWAGGSVNQLLVLTDPNTGCDFDKTTLAYANGDAADALDFLKINLFVRLWRKLGWTIPETDRAIQTFLPRKLQPLTAGNIGVAFRTVLAYLAHLKALDEEVKVGKGSRQKLLTLWANLPITGRSSLYAQLFLNRSILKNDVIFDDPLGQYLSSPTYLAAPAALKDHLLAVQGALGVTDDDLGRILAAARGRQPEEAQTVIEAEPLTLDTVSLIYRHGLLAKALKLSIAEMICLKALSGLDPVKSLAPDAINAIDEDYPFSQTIRFVEIAKAVKESGFRVEDLDYILRHRFDPVGKYRPRPDDVIALVRRLATEIRRVQREHAVPADAATFTDEGLQQKLALALPPDVAATFFAMWSATKEYEAIKTSVTSVNKLDPDAFSPETGIRVSYSEAKKEQRMSFRGVLTEARKTELKGAFPSPVVGALLDDVQKQARDYFEEHIQRSSAQEPIVGFLASGDFEMLFANAPPIPEDGPEAVKQAARQQNEVRMRAKRQRLAEVFLPFLQQRLIRQVVAQSLATDLGADAALTEAFLTDTRLVSEPGHGALLDAFSATGQQGITEEWFAASDGTGAPLPGSTGANSARLSGYLEVPASGSYRLFVTLDKKDAECELRFGQLPDPLLRSRASADGAEASDFVELKAGVPYQFILGAGKLGGGRVTLTILGENLPQGSLDRLTVYAGSAVERASRAYLLLAKALQLVQGFRLSEREIRYLLMNAADFGNLALGNLPTGEVGTEAQELFAQFLRLAAYARLKAELAPDTADLIGIFENARRVFPPSEDATAARKRVLADLCQRLADLTRRKVDSVQAAVEQFGISAVAVPDATALRVAVAEFAQEQGISVLWRALQMAEKLGVSAQSLARWATPAPGFGIAHDLRDTIKSKCEPEDWQRIAQPIFDKLRQAQRDALVAYVLHNHPEKFESADQLYEYFLIDPGMEPVVRTSRIRLAISSVQLFIQRCLLNLEKNVHPSAINSKHWQWMKRYRVWEANRKIFLFPENWLEPEFRDDKTHLFQELEGALLQGDVSNDLVEDALFNYVKKLEGLAHLEIVSMYCEEVAINPAANTLHVIGRTYTSPRKYFYRRYAQQMWTPWEPVTVEIESNHLVAAMWRDRLHLFWVTFMEKAAPPTEGATVIGENDSVGKIAGTVSKSKPLKGIDAQLSWSEYFQGQWGERRSGGFVVAKQPSDADWKPDEVSIHVTRDFEDGEEAAIRIHLGGGIGGCFKLVGRHSAPALEAGGALPANPYGLTDLRATQMFGDGKPLEVSFFEHFEGILPIDGPDVSSWAPGRLDLFVRGSDNALWHCPFFGSWSSWESLGTFITSDPAAVSWQKGRIDVFARGGDNALWHKWHSKGNGWSGWESLGGVLTSGPAVCSWAAKRLDVFVRGTDNALWHRWYDNGWSSWESLGGILTSDPAAVSWSAGRIDVFARGDDNGLWHLWYDGRWSVWESLGGGLSSGPAAGSWAPGRLDVFARGLDDALWHKGYDGGWSGWESLGGKLAADPAAVSWGRGRIDVIARGPDDVLRRRHFDVEWSDWEPIDSVLGYRPPDGERMTTRAILQENRNYSLLLSSNPSEYLFPEVGALMRPFFYQSERHALFAEPRVTDTTIEHWEEWVVTTPVLVPADDDFKLIKDVPMIQQVSKYQIAVPPDAISPHSRIGVQDRVDWLTHPQVVLNFDKQQIGSTGKFDAATAARVIFAAGGESVRAVGSHSPLADSVKFITIDNGKGVTAGHLEQLGSNAPAGLFSTRAASHV